MNLGLFERLGASLSAERLDRSREQRIARRPFGAGKDNGTRETEEDDTALVSATGMVPIG
jgi:hypothetical protein